MTLEEGKVFTGRVVTHALAAAGIKHEAAAAMMGIAPSQLCRQLQGQEHLSMQRLTQIEDGQFWLVFLTELRREFAVMERPSDVAAGLEQLVSTLSRVALELMHVRMAKAELPQRRASDHPELLKAVNS